MEENPEQKITKEDVSKKFIELLTKRVRSQDPKDHWNIIVDFMGFSLENFPKMTDEAKEVINGFQEIMLISIENQMVGMSDSIEVRQLKRNIRAARGKALLAQQSIKDLESPVQNPDEFQKKTRIVFEKRIQALMNFSHDIGENTLSGPSNFCKYALFGVCIDELLVAFHLTQKAYPSQAFSHFRTIQEAIDLMELFHKNPQEAELWTGDQEPWEIWKKFQPKEVRKRLHKDSIFRKIYSLLSGQGSHPSFEMLKARCKVYKGEEKREKPLIKISIGGNRYSRDYVFSHVLLVLMALQVLWQVIVCFMQFLNWDEIKKEMLFALEDFKNLFIDILVKPFQAGGKDVSEHLKFFEQMSKHMSELFRGDKPPS